jgi:hypothetical protein
MNNLILNLEQQRQIQYHHNRWWSSFSSGSNTTMSVVEIPWIATLLQIPIPDFKKYCISHIVLPYLVNVRKLSDNEAFAIMKEWLDKCNSFSNNKLSFNLLI